MQASVIIPTYKGIFFIPHVLKSLNMQRFKDFEAVIVIKPSGDGTEELVQKICGKVDFKCKILIQRTGYFTHALNMGLQHSEGELVLFTDDDAILPEDWIENHLHSHQRFSRSGAVSGRILHKHVGSRKPKLSKKEKSVSKLRRSLQWHLISPMFKGPHPLFKKYRLGVFITRGFTVATGFYIPSKLCFSLPCKGVNMSFKRAAIEDVLFPEHPLLKIAPYNEQYTGARIVLKGWESIYNPHIVVYHMVREGLSKFTNDVERRVMSKFFEELIREHDLRTLYSKET